MSGKPSPLFDAYKRSVLDSPSLIEPEGAIIYWPKKGLRRLLAWLLRRSLYDSLWVGPRDAQGKPDERVRMVFDWNSAGVLRITDEEEKE